MNKRTIVIDMEERVAGTFGAHAANIFTLGLSLTNYHDNERPWSPDAQAIRTKIKRALQELILLADIMQLPLTENQ